MNDSMKRARPASRGYPVVGTAPPGLKEAGGGWRGSEELGFSRDR